MYAFSNRARRGAALLALLAAVPALHAQDLPAKSAELRLSTAQSPVFPLGRAGERWAQLLNERSAGAIEVKQYPGSVLSERDPEREFGAVRDGRAELAVGSALSWSAQFAPLAVYSLPFLAPDARTQAALAADIELREQVFARMAEAGVVGLAVAPLGERVLASTKAALENPGDYSGLRVRVMPLRSVMDVYLALGALPRSLNFPLAQAALAAGTLDAQDALPTTLAATRAFASGQKFVTRWGAFAEVMVFAVRKASWDAWPEERRALVRGTAEQAAREANAMASEDAALAALTREGVTIVRLSAAQRAVLREAAGPAVAAWTAAVGEDLAAAAQAVVTNAAK